MPRCEERTGVLFRTAEILRRRKFEFNAWLVLEVGKNYDEAEADTGEAIDFLELYARQALVLDQAEPIVQLPGERGFLRYIPLGVGAVISPWNFPNAIALGMTGASLVCGNTVVLKPSSDSPTIAAKFFEALEEAGMPAGVVNFCPGSGATFGNGLVAHPKMRYIAFTGSRDVGLDIHYARRAAPEGTDLDQADGARDGRQGYHRGGCRCGSRFRGARCCRGRVRIPGTEVLGMFARHRAPGYLRLSSSKS